MIPEKNRIMYKNNDRFRRTVCLLLAVILWIPLLSSGGGKAEAASGWSMIDGGGTNGLNVFSANRAEYPAMAEWNGEVYLAWQEGPTASQIRVKKYTSTGWTSVDGNGSKGINMDTGKSGTRPAMAIFNGALYVAWVEEGTSSQGQIRVKKYNGGSSWTSAEGSSTSINFDATNAANFPALVAYNNALYAIWVEASKVYVKYYNGTEWTIANGGANGINVNPGNSPAFPAIAVLGNELVAVWSEVQGSVFQLRARKYNGTSWTTIDGGTTGLNMVNGKSATSPSVTVVDGALYAAWVEPVDSTTDDQIRVKKYDGNAWTSIDGNGKYGINVNPSYRAYEVKLAAINHEVYAVWSEHTGSGTIFKIRAKKYNGSTWMSAEDGRNGWIVDATKAAFYPAVAVLNNALYVAWQEKNSTAEQVRAALLPPPAVNSITVTPNPVSLAQGGSKQLQATVDASGGADPTVTWTSSDASNKVAVSSTGNVTVAADAAPGDYTITATSAFNNSKVGTATITVMLPTVNSVSVSPIKANITQGGSRQFNAAVNVVEGTEKTVNWTSSDAANKVTVDSTGNVTVAADAAPGTYTITVTSTVDNSKKATTTITVLAAPAINSVTVTPGTSSVAQGGSKQLMASVDAVGGAVTTVTWTSSDSSMVAVSGSGNVTVAADAALGDYTITATSTVNSGKKGTATITVTVPPAINSVIVTPDSYSVAQGGSKQLTATVDAVGGAATTVTWTSSDATNKVAVDSSGNVTVAVDAALGDYTITATSKVNNGKKGAAMITVTAPLAKETTPAAEIDYAAEQMTGLAPNGTYTINGTAVTADSSGKVNIAGSWLNATVNVVKKGNGTSTADSTAQAVTLPARPATPSAGKTDETSINGNDGTMTDVTSAMEYKKGTSGSWKEVTGTSVVNLAPDTYDVRIKATSSAFASLAQTVTIAAYNASPETTPVAEIDYAAEQLTGLEPNSAYTINGTAVTADSSGKVNIASSWLNATVNVVKKGNGTSTADSTAQAVALPARPATPTAGKRDETSINGNDGTITNVTSEMEYKKGTAGSWTDITGTSLTDMLPGSYDVRIKATSSAFASLAQTVTIAAYNASPETPPVAEIDYVAEQLTGLEPNGAYTINGTAVKADSSGKVNIAGSWLNATVNVVKKGNGTSTADSTAQVVALPARPATPNAGKTDETSINGNDGTLTDVTSAMEYKKGTSGSWTDVTGTSLTDLPPGMYDIRVKATSSAFASEAQQLTISAFGLSPEPKPAAGIDYAAEQLTGLAPYGAYIISGTTVTADGNGKVNIAGSWLGRAVNVVKKGNGTTTSDSAAQTLRLSARPAAPNVSADDVNNVIVGLDTTMEFSIDGGAYVLYDGTNMPQLSGEHTVHVRVASSGSVPTGSTATLIFNANVSVPAGGLTVTAGDPSGSANNGKTQVTVTPAVDDNHRLVYFNFGSGTVDVPNVGDTLSGYLNVPSDCMIPAANGDKIGIAEVDAQGRVVKFGQTAAIVILEQPGPQPGNETSTGPKEESVEVLINGKVENAGKATTTVSGGIKTTTVAVDSAKLQAKLDAEGVNAVVTIPVKSSSNVIVGELNGKMVKNMENLSATLILQTDKGTYTLPAKEINIKELAGKLGSSVKLEDIQLKVTVAQTPDTMAKVVENAASKGEFSVVAPALDFTVTGTYGGKTVEVTAFNVYVERMVALPDGIDPSKITTGVVVEPDGTVRHVPTKINLIEGKYYAKINSLTNSTYAVVWHPLEFSDAANHWAKDAVNDMGSRMVIEGTGNGTFSPDRDITRAEFAAIIVRGLGLKLENKATPFADVNASAWYNGAVHTAYAYHLISGFEDGTFRPNAKITREQAMAIIAKAMTITSLNAKLSEQSADVTLRSYVDAAEVSAWAQSGVADNIQSGIVTGRSGMKISPKAFITRAEVAVIVERLLRKSDLI